MKPNEMDLWKQITPEMMSEEESDGDTFTRHQPSYRSDKLTKFLSNLDRRWDKKPIVQLRTKRIIGSPIKKAIPAYANKWMVKTNAESNNNEHCEEENNHDTEPDDSDNE